MFANYQDHASPDLTTIGSMAQATFTHDLNECSCSRKAKQMAYPVLGSEVDSSYDREWVVLLDGAPAPVILRPRKQLGQIRDKRLQSQKFHLQGNLGTYGDDDTKPTERMQRILGSGRSGVEDRLQVVVRDGRLRYDSSRTTQENGEEDAQTLGCLPLRDEIEFWKSFDLVAGIFNIV